jgi:phage terminase large subunit-like protein
MKAGPKGEVSAAALPPLTARTPAGKVEEFFHTYLRHVKGEWAGKRLILAPWQREDILKPLFNTRRPDKLRQYRTCYVEVPRKNAKSTLAAGLMLYMLYADAEPGAEIISAASDRQQAHVTFDIAKSMVEAAPELKARTKIYRRELYVPHSDSSYKVISSEAYSKHGLNLYAAAVDELHAHENGELLEVLRTGFGSRRQPLLFMITTAGFDRTSVCWQERERAIRVRDGIDDDPTYLPVIYGASEQDDWRDPAVWKKANPGLGITLKPDYFATECQRAAQQPAYTNAFKRMHLNIWTTQSERWMEQALWDACDGPADLDALAGRSCYIGLDLGRTTDLSAMVLVFPEDGEEPAPVVPDEPDADRLIVPPGRRYTILARFWIPVERIDSPSFTRDARIKAILAQWVREGYITATRGDTVDNDVIRAAINALGATVRVEEIGYDPYSMHDMAPRLVDDGFVLTPLQQTMGMLSPATRELERLIRAKRLAHGGNPVMRWMFGNAQARVDADGRVKLDTNKSAEKIDGMDALVMAIRQASSAPSTTSIYDQRLRRGESVLTVV